MSQNVVGLSGQRKFLASRMDLSIPIAPVVEIYQKDMFRKCKVKEWH